MLWLLTHSASAQTITSPQAVWVVDPLTKISPDTLPPESGWPMVAAVELARNESESFQIVIRRLDSQPLRNVRLRATNLTRFLGKIDRSHIAWHLVGYTKMNKGVSADMLLPVESFDAPAEMTCAFYVSVRAPPNARAGDYTATLTLEADHAPPAKIALRVKVHNFTLPIGPGNCRTLFALQENRLRWSPERRRQYADFMLDHRLNPDDIYRHQPPRVEDLEHYLERGLNAFTIKKVARGWGHEPIRVFLDELSRSRRGAELRKLAFFYGYDERAREHWPAMADCFADLKAQFPDIATITTAHVYMDWDDPPAVMRAHHLDAVAPWIHPGYPLYYRYDDGVKVRAAGGQLWAYNINFQTHCPLIDSRALWWQMYHQRADGWMYYAVNAWAKDVEPIDPGEVSRRGPMVDYTPHTPNSQGELIYPGVAGPIGSLRLANIRDGIEDYEYLRLLERKLGSVERAREICAEVAWGVLQWTDDPRKLYETRARIARMLTTP